MIAILGSGFGLYGYLPALAGLAGQQIVLPLRYRPRLMLRSELAVFACQITWVETEDQALDQAECVVIALQPKDQPAKVLACLDRPNIRRFMIEKPLAATEAEGAALLDLLLNGDHAFRVGYIFCFLPWANKIRQMCKSFDVLSVEIKWHFNAQYFRRNQNIWKRREQDGGGPLRFYGIQVLALFAELGFGQVVSSTLTARSAGEVDQWVATMNGTGLPMAKIMIDARASEESFVISTGTAGGESVLIQGRTPFDEVAQVTTFVGTDARATLLYKLFQSFDENSDKYYQCYLGAQDLWRQSETKLQYL